MRFLLQFALQFHQAVSRLPLPSSKPNSSHGALHTGSSSERFTLLEALFKSFNTVQSNYV